MVRLGKVSFQKYSSNTHEEEISYIIEHKPEVPRAENLSFSTALEQQIHEREEKAASASS
jgi:hypothetical protein